MNRTIAILVNYNGFKDTKEAVNSLKKQTLSFYKIIIIDNCSTDSSYLDLKSEYNNVEDVLILRSEKNGGFSYGNNFGMKYAINNFKFDKFLLINNDTISDIKMHEVFLKFYENYAEKNKIGILTGKIYYYRPKDLIWFAGGDFKKYKAIGCHFGENIKDNGKYDEIKEVKFATACLWFFDKSLIERVGYMPEEYFMYFEDLDYSLNVINKGFKIIYLPQVKIWHKIGASSNISGRIPNYKLLNRNRRILAKKYLNEKEIIIFSLFMILRGCIFFVKHLINDKKIVNTF